MSVLATTEEALLKRYLKEAGSLSAKARLEFVIRLLSSVVPHKGAISKSRKSLLDFAGAWNDMPESADELADKISKARTVNSPRQSFD